MRRPMSWLVMAVLAASAGPLFGQEVLWSFVQGSNENGFGSSSATNADVNGDGFADVIIGVPGRIVAGYTCGAVYVFSGKDGSKLWDVTYNPIYSSSFGYRVTGLKDIDGDGCDEFVGSSILGRIVIVFSGKTGLPLLTIGPTTTTGFGSILDDAGDHDGDGLHDLIIGRTGGVEIDSSAGGTRIVDLVPSGKLFKYGVSAANAGDVDADGFDDVIVGDPDAGPFVWSTCHCQNSGKVYVFSGKDGSVLYEILGSSNPYLDSTVCTTFTTGWGGGSTFCFGNYHKPEFGFSVDGVGDVDGDGHADYLIGRPGFTWVPNSNVDVGHAFVYSGATGTLLFDLVGDSSFYSNLGVQVARCGDVNGDGLPDALAGDSSDNGDYLYSGLNGVRLYLHDAIPVSDSLRAGADVDGDGRADLPFTFTIPGSNTAELDLIAGSSLFVSFSLHEIWYYSYGAVTISSAQQPAGSIGLLALTEVGGTPVFSPLALGTFDATGVFAQTFYTSGGLTRDTYGVQAFTIDANGRLLASGIDRIVVR